MRTHRHGVELFHTVLLGEGMAEHLVGLLKKYAHRARVVLPLVTLEGNVWSRSWSEIESLEGFGGRVGEPDSPEHDRFILREPTALRLAAKESIVGLCPMTLEGIIAHEIVHIRWPELDHGDIFWERTLGLLRGDVFSPPHDTP